MTTNSIPNKIEQVLENERWSFWAGIIFAILFFVGIIAFIIIVIPTLPPIDAPTSAKVEFYTGLGSMISFNNYLWVVPMPFFLFFLGGLYSFLMRHASETQALALAGLLAGIGMTIPWVTNTAVESLAVFMAQTGGDSSVIAAFDGLGPTGSIGLAGLIRAAFLFAIARSLLQAGIAGRGLPYFGFFLALCSVIGSFTFFNGTFLMLAYPTLILTMIWILLLSISLLRQVKNETRDL